MAKYTINFGDGTIKETDNLGESFEHKYDDGLDKHTITVRGECGTFNAKLEEVQTTYRLNIAYDSTMCSVRGNGIYNEGTDVYVKCTPKDCYEFVQWSDGDTTNPRTINVDRDISISVIMEIKKYTVKLSGSNCTFVGAGTYDCGKSVKITCKPADGYRFVQWNDGDTNPQKTFTITGNRTYTATCEKVETSVCITSGESLTIVGRDFYEGGTFSVNSDCYGVRLHTEFMDVRKFENFSSLLYMYKKGFSWTITAKGSWSTEVVTQHEENVTNRSAMIPSRASDSEYYRVTIGPLDGTYKQMVSQTDEPSVVFGLYDKSIKIMNELKLNPEELMSENSFVITKASDVVQIRLTTHNVDIDGYIPIKVTKVTTD